MKDQVKVESVASQKSIKTTNNEMTNLEVHRELSETSSKNLLIEVSFLFSSICFLFIHSTENTKLDKFFFA